MSPFDIAIIVLVCVAFAGVCGWLIWRKVKHKGGCCGCECGAHCLNGSCGSCNAHGQNGGEGGSCPHCNGEDKK